MTNLEWWRWSTSRKLDKSSRPVACTNSDWTVHTRCEVWQEVLNKRSVRTQIFTQGLQNSPHYEVFSHLLHSVGIQPLSGTVTVLSTSHQCRAILNLCWWNLCLKQTYIIPKVGCARRHVKGSRFRHKLGA